MAEEEGTQHVATGGSAFTNKEMWVRVDAKLDTLVARQQHFDVELALLKERTHQHDVALARHASTEEADRAVLAASLREAEALMAKEVQALKDGQLSVSKAVRWAAAVVIGMTVMVDAAIRFFKA